MISITFFGIRKVGRLSSILSVQFFPFPQYPPIEEAGQFEENAAGSLLRRKEK
jgi:hypothetical protein